MTEIEKLLDSLAQYEDIPSRLIAASRLFLSKPYSEHPLIGSSTEEERFVCDVNSFDCVTFSETCIALALSRSEKVFEDTLKRIRYRNGNVTWHDRNHYMYLWIQNNTSQGFIHPLFTSHEKNIICEKTLSCLPGYPPVQATLELLPVDALSASDVQSGDVILFGSTKADLDVFHLGLLRVEKNDIFLIHASKSLGGVCEELLSHFVARNEIIGFILVRPVANS